MHPLDVNTKVKVVQQCMCVCQNPISESLT